MARIPDKIFKELVDIVYKESGIVLSDKRELMEARLAGLSHRKGYRGPEEIITRLKADTTGEALVELIDQISTNLTYFFREQAHFDFLARVLMPELLARKEAEREKRIRFWSAACASGEEPYSLAMVIHDYLGGDDSWDIKIMATDISTRALQKAYEGRYSRQEVLKAPESIVRRYFDSKGDRYDPVYEVIGEIKRTVAFGRLNLLDEDYPFSERFDLIICRNVMIYFDQSTRQAVLTHFQRCMQDGGYLFIGHAESLAFCDDLFKRVQAAVYRNSGPDSGGPLGQG